MTRNFDGGWASEAPNESLTRIAIASCYNQPFVLDSLSPSVTIEKGSIFEFKDGIRRV